MQQGYVVSGRVQGVGFRWWTQKTGAGLGLGGTVLNLPDGSVEVHAHGAEASMEKFSGLLRKGPWSAVVETVEHIPSSGSLPESFEVIF